MAGYRAATFANSTKRSYLTHQRRYLDFCNRMGVPPVPASSTTIVRYAAFLARHMKPASVRQYLNVIRVLHLESNLPNPLHDNWYVKSTLSGTDRLLGVPVTRRTPVHPLVLTDIYFLLDLDKPLDAMVWAACMVMFYGILRKSNLFPDTPEQFDPQKQFVRSDFSQSQDGSITVHVKYSKTNQFHQRPFDLKLLPVDRVLSPVASIHKAFGLIPLARDAPAFVSSPSGIPMAGHVFNRRFKQLIASTGRDSATYSSHSFRRGGASWALECGVPGEVVQALGDWKSDCYKRYLDTLPQSVHDHYRHLLVKFLPAPPTHL